MDLVRLRKELTVSFLDDPASPPLPRDGYSSFSYPKFPKLMRFDVERYRVPGFGHLMTMYTKGPFGMELLTCSFLPGEGKAVPYLLIDMMGVGKKRTVFVEYYDCTAQPGEHPGLRDVFDRYRGLPDYQEKPAWYIGERTPYSLIKGGTAEQEDRLVKMVLDSVAAYRSAAMAAPADARNLPGLLAFRDRMVTEGNPSSAVLEKVFGKEGARDFFTTCVMPAD